MKWQIAPEFRQEYWKKQAKRGGGGSAPSSPASGKEVNPNFRGPNGQNLGYDTTMVSQFSARDLSDHRSAALHSAKTSTASQTTVPFPQFPTRPPYPSGPSLLPPPSQAPDATTTPPPQRRRADTQNTLPDNTNELDDSPLPHGHLRPTPRPNSGLPAYSLPPSAPLLHHSPTNPTLSSSYLDTPFHPSQQSIITPAPLRQNPRLAPPSTLVAPSKFMPESSPAGPGLFWKGLMGVTPGSALPDMSPVKDEDLRANGVDRNVMSSSPPPIDAGMGSPSKPARSSQVPAPGSSLKKEEAKPNGMVEEHNRRPSLGLTRPRNGSTGLSVNPQVNTKNEPGHDEEDEDGDGGFDLAKGFAPIGGGSFPSRRSGSIVNTARAG